MEIAHVGTAQCVECTPVIRIPAPESQHTQKKHNLWGLQSLPPGTLSNAEALRKHGRRNECPLVPMQTHSQQPVRDSRGGTVLPITKSASLPRVTVEFIPYPKCAGSEL